MRKIDKGTEPHQLKNYRELPGAVYDGPDFTTEKNVTSVKEQKSVKDVIRASLLAEQGYLCAYCMQRIDANSMKIEHWRCQARYPNEQLNYKNLLACCKGNEGNSPQEQHCDTKKGDRDIFFNPADPAHHSRLQIHYSGDGTIRSDDSNFDKEMDDVLNLNFARLKNNRKSTLEGVLEGLSHNKGPRTKNEIRKMISKWAQRDTGRKFQEYCDVAIYYLNKRLKSMPKKSAQ